jgi:protease-4
MENQNKPRKKGFFEIIKNLFWVLLFLQFAPVVFYNLKKTLEEAIVPKTHVGHLKITGTITDSTFYVKKIRKFLKSKDIKALLLKVDSPGGLPGSAQAIADELEKFKEKKPVISFIENIGTSAAYNIAAAANYVVATNSSLVGSIGVWMQIPPNVKKLAEDWKIKFRTINTGDYKTAGSPFQDMTTEQNAHLQSVSDDSYDQFVKDIAQRRNLSVEDHKNWADGKVFTGNQALELKLVDKLGSELDAITELKKQALIPKEDEIKFVRPKRPSKFMRLFAGEDDIENETHFSSYAADFVADIIQKVTNKLNTKQAIAV